MSPSTSEKSVLKCTVEGCKREEELSRHADLERHVKEVHGAKIKCEYPDCTWPGAKRVSRYHAHLKDKHGVAPEFELIIPDGFLQPSGPMEYVPNPQQALDNSPFQNGYLQTYSQGPAPVSTSLNQTQEFPPIQNYDNAGAPLSLYGSQGGMNGTQPDFQLYGSSPTPPSYDFHNGGYTGCSYN